MVPHEFGQVMIDNFVKMACYRVQQIKALLSTMYFVDITLLATTKVDTVDLQNVQSASYALSDQK